MNVLLTLVLAVQIMSALAMIGLILIQHGKGADMGAAFGSGGSGSLFGASGSANFMSRATAVLAGVFFVCTLALAYFGMARPTGSGSVLERAGAVAPVTAPASAAKPMSPADQIPGAGPSATPAPATAPAAATPAEPAASGAAAIPGK
jgi:preprotein translocase subunit SecG